MLNLRVFFVMGVVISVLVMCAFAPGICIERFLLPEGVHMESAGPFHASEDRCLAENGNDGSEN